MCDVWPTSVRITAAETSYYVDKLKYILLIENMCSILIHTVCIVLTRVENETDVYTICVLPHHFCYVICITS